MGVTRDEIVGTGMMIDEVTSSGLISLDSGNLDLT